MKLGRAHLYFLPRASNALLKLLRNWELKGEKGKILFPANICYTFPLAATLSSWEVEFSDVDYSTGYISLRDVDFAELKALVFVIPYGNFLIDEFQGIRNALTPLRLTGARIIWDFALVLPTSDLLNYILSTIEEGEFFIFSFSYGKQLEIGYGALLISSKPIEYRFQAEISKEEARYYINKVDKLFRGAISKYGSSLYLKLRDNPKVRRGYESELSEESRKPLAELFEEIVSGGDPLLELKDGRAFLLSEIIEMKLEINRLYRENFLELAETYDLDREALELLDRSPLSWRFNLRLHPDLRDEILDAIFERGLFASRQFPVIAKYFGRDDRTYHNAGENWRRIINLFNNHLVDEEFLERTLEVFEEKLKRWKRRA